LHRRKVLKIGLSTLYLITKPFNYLVQKIPMLNTKFIEIIDDGLHSINKRRAKILKELAETYELEFSIHAPFADINLASLNNSIRRVMMKRLEKSLHYASEMEVKIWVFHPGARTALTYFYPQREWKNNVESAKRLLKLAKNLGVKIAIENLPPPYPLLMNNVNDFVRFYDEVSEEIGITLDIGHANLNGQTELFLELFHDKIVHMHASDNDGKNDLHLGIGEGTINWKKICRKIREVGFKGSIIIESVQKVEESLEKLKNFYFKCFSMELQFS